MNHNCRRIVCMCLEFEILPCLQVRGHSIAKLDPLGISCVNFDDAAVTLGLKDVGESRSFELCVCVCV